MRAMVCINKYDLNEENAERVERDCRDRGVEIAGRIPFDNIVTESIVLGVPVVEHSRGNVSREIGNIWSRVSDSLRS